MTRGWNPRWLAYAAATGATDPVEAQNRDDRVHGSALLPFQRWIEAQQLAFPLRAPGDASNAFTRWLLATHVSAEAAAAFDLSLTAPPAVATVPAVEPFPLNETIRSARRQEDLRRAHARLQASAPPVKDGDVLALKCTAKVFPLTEQKARDCGREAKTLTQRGPRCLLHARKGRPTS